MNPDHIPPPGYLHECLIYNPETGDLRWRHRPRSHFKTDARWRQFNTRFADKVAGTLTSSLGYRVVTIEGLGYYAHRIIWAMQTGDWPEDEIDHANRSRSDNRWNNLREATHQQNVWNSGPKKGRELPIGVVRHRQRYIARCVQNGTPTRIGIFDTPEAARAAYVAFAGKRREGFAPC